MSKKIKLISKISSNINLYLPEYHYSRDFTKEGQTHIIDKDVLDQAIYTPSVMAMFENGLLYIDDEDARIEYGLEVKDEKGNIEHAPTILSSEEVYEKLTTLNLADLKKVVDELPPVQQQRFVDVAIEKGYMDYAKNIYFKKLTGRDIIKTIEITKEEEVDE